MRQVDLNPLRALRRWRDNRYQKQLQHRGWYDPAARSEQAPIFIGGCWRSGTSLLREILGRHPNLACGPESHLFALPFQTARLARQWSRDRRELEALAGRCSTLVEFGECFFGEMAVSQGKTRWIDKTPQNARVADRLLTWFPRGRFLHVVRDGRDVVCSLRSYPKEDFVDGRRVPAAPVDRDIGSCVRTWAKETREGLQTGDDPRYMEIRYEELVLRPEPLVRSICDFLGEEFVPGMLEPEAEGDPANSPDPVVTARFVNNPEAAGALHHKSIGRWKTELTRDERHVVWDNGGELLVELGYCADDGWVGE